MGVTTSAGGRLYIGTTATAAATDTYTEVGEVIKIGAMGRTYNKIEYLPLNARGVKKFKGGFNDGDPEISLGKDINDAGQALMKAASLTDYDYNFKIVDNDDVAPASATVTITIAAPGVVTWTAHGLPAGTAVSFSTTGALPTGLTADTTYYVTSGATLLTNSFALSSTLALSTAGTAITTSGTQSGVHTGTSIPAGSYETFKAQVFSYVTGERAPEAIIGATAMLGIQSGTGASQVHLP